MTPIPTPSGFALKFLTHPHRREWNHEVDVIFAAVTEDPRVPLPATIYAYCVLTLQALLEEGVSADECDDNFSDLIAAQAYIGLYKRRHKLRSKDHEVPVDYDAVVKAFGLYDTGNASSCSPESSQIITPSPTRLIPSPTSQEPVFDVPVPWTNGFGCFKRKTPDDDDSNVRNRRGVVKRLRVGQAPDGPADWSEIRFVNTTTSDSAQEYQVRGYDNLVYDCQGRLARIQSTTLEQEMVAHHWREKSRKAWGEVAEVFSEDEP
ncbi:hypothetical protein ACHAQH_003422 [Verticillium albo-atrum]